MVMHPTADRSVMSGITWAVVTLLIVIALSLMAGAGSEVVPTPVPTTQDVTP